MTRPMTTIKSTNTPNPITTGADLRAARLALGLSTVQLAKWLGYGGTRDSMARRISNMETGVHAVPRLVGIVVECLMQGARPSTALAEIAEPPLIPTRRRT